MGCVGGGVRGGERGEGPGFEHQRITAAQTHPPLRREGWGNNCVEKILRIPLLSNQIT